jgi:hypothetical protein
MRAFIEAAAVDEQFRDQWWAMRRRHVDRFSAALQRARGLDSVGGVDIRLAADAMACMVEQCCYVWFAHEQLNEELVSVADATRICTHVWYTGFFAPSESVPSAVR